MNLSGFADSAIVLDFLVNARCVLYLRIRLAASATGYGCVVGSSPNRTWSLAHCMNARILFFTPGDRRICPWLRGNSAYDLKSASTSSIVLSMHVVYASSNMSNAILCALVCPFHNVTSLTPHDAIAIRTV